VLPLEC